MKDFTNRLHNFEGVAYHISNLQKYRLDAMDLVLDFVNTAHMERGTDDISAPAGLSAWLQSRGFTSADTWMTVEDAAWVVDFRESLRELIGTNIGIPLSAHGLEMLNRTARTSSLAMAFSGTGVGRMEPIRHGVEGAVGWILAAVATAVADGSWHRLKLCGNPRCRRAYYDRSKNRSRVWCEMAACGNRAKVRAYRERKGAVWSDPRRAAGPEAAAGLPQNRIRR